MKPTNKMAVYCSRIASSVVCVVILGAAVYGQAEPLETNQSKALYLLQQMAGTWDVQQRMREGAGLEQINLPSAKARRQLVEGLFLEEVMTPEQPSEKDSFTRTAYLNYNPVNRQYEYVSLDSRAPQMMTYDKKGQNTKTTSLLKFTGGRFLAPQWGKSRNVTFTYRLTIGMIVNDQQILRLYLTPEGKTGREFVAFEYIYTRTR